LIILDVWKNVEKCLIHLFWFFIEYQINVNVLINCCLNASKFNFELIILDVWMHITRCLVHLLWFSIECQINVNVFIYCCLNVGAWKIDHSCKRILFWKYMFKVSPSVIEEQICASCYCFFFLPMYGMRVFFSKNKMKHCYLESQERFNINWWHIFRKLSKQWKISENCLQTKNTIGHVTKKKFKFLFVLNS
jgi:hypothetical protein